MNITHTLCRKCPVPLPRVCPHVEPYDVIVVDPPWAYGSDSGRPNRTAESQYKTIGNRGKEVNRRTGAGIENIIASVPIAAWSKPDAHLYLWTTNPKLPFAFDVMAAWGFTYKTTITWEKVTGVGAVHRGGMGWFFRGATEHVLFGVRGRKPIPAALRQANCFRAIPSREHSAKPDAFYHLVDEVTPKGRRLDVFARRLRDGWDSYGDEADGTRRSVRKAG